MGSGVRPGGRPRDTSKELAVLEATRTILATEGYSAVTIDAVAQRTGIARTTIYRRWPSKLQMVAAAIGDLGTPPQPDTGSLRDDLVAVMRHTVALFNSSEFRRTAPGLVAELRGNPELDDMLQQTIIGHRRKAVRVILRRGVRRGELRRGTDLDLLMDQLTGPLWYRAAVRGSELRPGHGDRIVDTVLAYYAVRDGAAPRR